MLCSFTSIGIGNRGTECNNRGLSAAATVGPGGSIFLLQMVRGTIDSAVDSLGRPLLGETI